MQTEGLERRAWWALSAARGRGCHARETVEGRSGGAESLWRLHWRWELLPSAAGCAAAVAVGPAVGIVALLPLCSGLLRGHAGRPGAFQGVRGARLPYFEQFWSPRGCMRGSTAAMRIGGAQGLGRDSQDHQAAGDGCAAGSGRRPLLESFGWCSGFLWRYGECPSRSDGDTRRSDGDVTGRWMSQKVC